MKNLAVFYFLIFSVFIVYSQENNNYQPKNIDSYIDYFKIIKTKKIKSVKGKHSSKIKKIYKNLEKKRVKSIKDSTFIFNSILTSNLNEILDEIYVSNPQIDTTNYRFFIKNTIVPNAACYGDGAFEINLGLLNTLETDGEIAFVICHEIAHKLLNHVDKKINRSVFKMNSKETKRKVKSIKKQKYGRTRAAMSVIEELQLDILNHSKKTEIEADSLGFILFSKTKYDKNQALKSLAKLKYEDEMIFDHPVALDSIFNFTNYPFKDYWLKKQTSLFNSEEVIDEFSLKSDTINSHPKIDERINKLSESFSIKSSHPGFDKNMNAINSISQTLSINSAFDFKNIDLAMYQLVQKHDIKQINDAFYYTHMARLLKLLYKTKKEHEFGKYVPTSNNFSDEKELNKIRLFLHNLELFEIKKIGLAFCEKNRDYSNNSPIYNETLTFFKNLNIK